MLIFEVVLILRVNTVPCDMALSFTYPQFRSKSDKNNTIQENTDAEHQYAGKLICHALLSSL